MLQAACQKIANAFYLFGRTQFVVSVKIIVKKDGVSHSQTLERSEALCRRDKDQPSQYEVGTSRNTGLDEALRYKDGELSYFHSKNLDKLGHAYRNDRQNWRSYYVSTIVVPIRWIDKTKTPRGSHDLGFLTIDTLSENRLNGSWHVEIMAAFADQMYNFMCLMRAQIGAGTEARFDGTIDAENKSVT